MWIINFRDWPLDGTSCPPEYSGPVATDYPDCLQIIREKVKPDRDTNPRKARKERWWHYAEKAVGLYKAIQGKNWSLAIATGATKYVAFARVTPRTVFSHALAIVANESNEIFACLNSSIHDAWARKHGSYNLLLLRYAPSDLYETFPLPPMSADLSRIGQSYYEHRREVLQTRQEGLTDTYNRFHERGEQSADIARLRALHVEMDQSVTAAYGWSDLDLGHGFHPTKQGERYTLSDSTRHEVLNRLLSLNHQRYAEELAAGLHEKKSKKPTAAKPATKRGRKAKTSAPETGVPVMPADFRFPAPSPQLYAVNLVTALLSARPDGLAWPVLRDACAAVTTPDLMRRLALPEDKDRVAAWASRWNERASPGLLIPTLREMTSANIAVDGNGTRAVFSLQDGPQEPATEDVGYDAWLALRVIEPLSTLILPDAEAAALDAEIEALLAAI